MKKSIAAVALAGSISLAGAVPAVASFPQYPGTPQECAVVSSSTVTVGVPFTLRGAASAGCFVPGAQLTVTVALNGAPQASGGGIAGGLSAAVPVRVPLSTQTLNTTADASGNYSVDVTIDNPGEYTLTVSGAGGAYSTVVEAAAATAGGVANPATSGTGLAETGADSGIILWSLVGAGALAAGAASVVVVRRRANSETAA